MRQSLLGSSVVLLGVLSLVPGLAAAQDQTSATDTQNVPRTAWGHPDLQGIWDQTTGTPLERPDEYAGREFLTEEEAVAREESRFAQFDNPDRGPRNPTSDYGSEWREGSKNSLRRTSLIVAPPNGRVPPLTPQAQAANEARARARRQRGPADSWKDLNLWTRCVTRGTPRIPNNYNSNWHILQTPDFVVIHQEMINETRIIPLDGRPGLGEHIRLWNGVSRGHWEDETLVVETTGFNDQQRLRSYPLETARVIERFRRAGPHALEYSFTIDDPATFTAPWTVSLPFVPGTAYYEYACHEGNYGMTNILAGTRIEERAGATGTR